LKSGRLSWVVVFKIDVREIHTCGLSDFSERTLIRLPRLRLRFASGTKLKASRRHLTLVVRCKVGVLIKVMFGLHLLPNLFANRSLALQ
jgi:hypothetical protein